MRGEPVSTATDIYSLGVLLYQMLTGARPTGRHATTPLAAAKSVLEEPPTRPSRLSPQESPDPRWLATRKRLEGDLDNILLKALEKEPERRYASVDAMAADVQACLDGRPVSAPAAQATVARALVLSDQAWPQRRGDWRLASWTGRVRVVQAQLARRDGRLDDAVATLQRAADQAAESLQQRQGAEGQLYLASGLANVHLNLAQVFDHGNLPSLQRPDDALREYRRAEQALRDLLARKDDLAELDRKAAPGDTSCESYLVHQIAVIHGGRALVHLRQGAWPAMRQEAEAAVALMQQNVLADPHNVAWRDGLMTESHTLSKALLGLGERAGALQAAQRAWDVAQLLAKDEGPQSKWAHASVQAMLGQQLALAWLSRLGD